MIYLNYLFYISNISVIAFLKKYILFNVHFTKNMSIKLNLDKVSMIF